MTFAGLLSDFGFAEIVQLISVSRKTGVLHITNGSHGGGLYLRDGDIVHAHAGNVGGEEAVYVLALVREGQFEFEAGVAAERRTISKSNATLLVEAARRLDEVATKTLSADLVPEFLTQTRRDGPISIGRAEWLVLSKLDGRRNVETIAAETGLTTDDTAEVLCGLASAGLICLRKPGVRSGDLGPQGS